MTLPGRSDITPARLRALCVLAAQHPGCVRESNDTNERVGHIYWQSSRWLVSHELAYYPSGSTMVALTVAGVELVNEMGLRP